MTLVLATTVGKASQHLPLNPIRLLLSASLLFGLYACGGSSQHANQQAEAENNPAGAIEKIALMGVAEDYGPYTDYAKLLSQSYTGNAQLAELSIDTAPHFIDAALFGAFNSKSLKNHTFQFPAQALVALSSNLFTQAAGNERESLNEYDSLFTFFSTGDQETRNCQLLEAGTVSWTNNGELIVDHVSGSEVKISFQKCTIDSRLQFNGDIFLSSFDLSHSGSVATRYIKYNNLVVALPGGETLLLSGVAALHGGTDCTNTPYLQSYVLVENTAEQEQWLFENVKSTLLTNDLRESCIAPADTEKPMPLHAGVIANNIYGVVSSVLSEDASSGHLTELHGIDGNYIQYRSEQTEAPDEIDLSLYDITKRYIRFARITIVSNNEGVFESRHAMEAIGGGSLLSLHDTDGDKILDGWERLYGMDILNAADAGEDADGDHLTAMQEYVLGANPINANDAGWLSDSSIVLNPAFRKPFENLGDSRTRYKFDVSVPEEETNVKAKSFSYTLNIIGDAIFEHEQPDSPIPEYWENNESNMGNTSCIFVGSDRRNISCVAQMDRHCTQSLHSENTVVQCEGHQLLPRSFSVTAPVGGAFTIKATLQAGSQELNVDNNVASYTVEP